MKLSEKFRPYVKWGVNTLTGAGIVTSFFTLPTVVAVPLSIVGAAASWGVSKLIFESRILFLHSGMEFLAGAYSPIGTCWGTDVQKDITYPSLGIVHENQDAAQMTYRILRTWNYGKYIDPNGNIHVSIVDEGQNKFSVFIYPGQRAAIIEGIKEQHLSSLEPNSNVEVGEIKFWLHFCMDYSDRPHVSQFMSTLKNADTLLLNTYYVKDEKLTPYAKRNFQLRSFEFLNRVDVTENTIEYQIEWLDSKEQHPEIVERMKSIKF